MASQGPPGSSATRPRRAWAGGVLAALALGGAPVHGQETVEGFTIIPVTVEMGAGQRAAALTFQNDSDKDAAFQVRPYAWGQPQGPDELAATDDLVVSPPLGVVPAHGRQLVRLVLRRPADAQKETAYRILIDQIPPAPPPGSIGFSLRISLPVFAEPATRAAARVHWRVETTDAAAFLVGVNDGTRREVVRNMALTGPGGQAAQLEAGLSPYILAGATRRWRILSSGPAPASGQAFRLTAHADTGAIDQPVAVSRVAP